MKNITLKMYDMEVAGNGFHTKGYIFKKEEIYRKFEEESVAGRREGMLISATGAHVILMTGRKALIYKEFGPVFSIL